jgi:hypothetical protein
LLGGVISGNRVNTTTGDITNSSATIQGRELVALNATQDIANIGGAVNSVVIEAGVATSSVSFARKTNNSGFLSSSTSSTQAIASNFGGNTVVVTIVKAK